jgi:nucleoside-triphosphatase THEP1
MKKAFLILTAPKGIGKTTRLQQLVKKAGGNVGGVLSPVIENKRHFMHVASERLWQMEASGDEKRLDIGKFSFSQQAFDKAASILLEDLLAPQIQTLIIDEIGPLELKGLGFHDLLFTLIRQKKESQQLCIVVREGLHEAVMAHFGISDQQLVIVNHPSLLDFENGYFYPINP